MSKRWLRFLVAILFPALVMTSVAGVETARAQNLVPDTSVAPEDMIDVDLQLVLAVDVSASIDAEEGRLQRDGYVKAIIDPLVIQAIQAGPNGRIAVAYMEWSGPLHQRVVVDWRVIDGPESAIAFAELLDQAPMLAGRRTSISGAIQHAVGIFHKAKQFRAARKVIDISGDGPNNGGFYVHQTRFRAFENGITINGLPIHNDRPSPLGIPATPNIDLYYEDCVIGGPGAFIVVAETLRSFAAAVRRKLILEIAGLQPPPRDRRQARVGKGAETGIVPAQLAVGLTDCTIGERQYDLFRQRQNLKN
jgi:hypothetical protein